MSETDHNTDDVQKFDLEDAVELELEHIEELVYYGDSRTRPNRRRKTKRNPINTRKDKRRKQRSPRKRKNRAQTSPNDNREYNQR